MASEHTSVVIEADGGSRGNPGKAAYGALLLDAGTREVIAERAECIGIATNNVAEYRGLIAGLELYHEHTPEADLEVRMDSKLVVEQMSGNWKIKHPDMKPLAMAAHRLAPFGTTYTWIPRAENTHADRILNEALDEAAGTVRKTRPAGRTERDPKAPEKITGWSPDTGTPTTLVLVRHGVTEHTVGKRFSSGMKGQNPGLSDDGKAQARATADWLAPLAEEIDVLVCSPARRARETAEIVAARLDKDVEIDDGLVEMEFGTWDGLTFAEVSERHADDLEAWLGSLDHPPGGGESFTQVQQRVHASLDRLLTSFPGKTVLAVSHVTPIKVLVAQALGAPLDAVYRMELAPASVTVISWFPEDPSTGSGHRASMRMFNARPMESAFLGR
jgi:ribonuclease H / adenosylcobalamin/alpha-ribazole phosphatase